MAILTARPTPLAICLSGRRQTRLRRLLLVGVLACASLVCASLAPAIAGELYQWTDANGVTHYSDSPPPNRQYQSRVIGQDESDSEAVAATEPAEAKESSQCTSARANLALLQKDAPVGLDSDKDGKPDAEFTDEQRAAQTELAKASIKVHCADAEKSATASTAPAA